MDQTGLLIRLEQFDRLFFGDAAAAAGADVVVRGLAQLHAAVFHGMRATLADHFGGQTAGAVRDGVGVHLVKERADVLKAVDLPLRVDFLHDRGDLQEAAFLRVDELQDLAGQDVVDIPEHLGHLGVLLGLRIGHDVLVEARDERGDVVKELSAGLTFEHDALLRHVLEHRRRLLRRDAAEFGDLLDRGGFLRNDTAQFRLFFGNELFEHFGEDRVFTKRADHKAALHTDVSRETTPCACHMALSFLRNTFDFRMFRMCPNIIPVIL